MRNDALSALTLQFLAWVAARPRTYAETLDAWRSTCPRLTVWEDAQLMGLIEVRHRGGGTSNGVAVTLTPAGKALLDSSRQ